MKHLNNRKIVDFIYEVKKWKSFGGRKWLDELEKSFGAKYILKEIFSFDTSLISAFSELSGKNYTVLRKELETDALVAERILSLIGKEPDPVEVCSDFKLILATTLIQEVPNLYNKYEFMLNRQSLSKQEEFNDEVRS